MGGRERDFWRNLGEDAGTVLLSMSKFKIWRWVGMIFEEKVRDVVVRGGELEGLIRTV